MSDSNHTAPCTGDEGAVSEIATLPPSAVYTLPSLVNSHLSLVSFQRTRTLADVPRSTSMPAFVVGEPVTLLFKTTMLSSIANVSVFKVVVVPLTVRFPSTVTSLNCTLDAVPTA